MTDSATGPRKYQLLAELGHGGMADVFLAVLRGPTDFKKLAVVKRLRGHLAEDAEFLAMFLQEARIAARLNHPNVVSTFEVGHDGRHHFMAMEYLQGQSLSALAARVGRERLDLSLQLKILIDALEGLHYAHELQDFDGSRLQLVHRDVSPQNIFVTYDGLVKVLDFGIAKALDSAVETRTGVIKGKLSYMSPEQALAGTVDRRADLYSVGVILWEAIAKRRRFKGLSNVQIMKLLVNEKNPQLPPMAGLPRELALTLKKALAFEPEERHRDALELQAELEQALDALGQRVTNRQLGQLLKREFEAERNKLQAIIESELARLDSGSPEPVGRETSPSEDLIRLDLPPASGTPSFRLDLVDQPPVSVTPSGVQRAVTDQSSTLSVSELIDVSKPHPAPSRIKRVAWLAAIAVSAALGAVAFVHWSGTRHTASEHVAPAETVEIRLAANPAEASLFLNDERLATNPYVASLPKSSDVAVVRAELDGYVSQTRMVQLGANVQVELSLTKQAEPSAAASSTAAAPVERAKPSHARAPRAPATKPKAETTATPVEPAPSASARPSQPRGVILDTDNPWK